MKILKMKSKLLFPLTTVKSFIREVSIIILHTLFVFQYTNHKEVSFLSSFYPSYLLTVVCYVKIYSIRRLLVGSSPLSFAGNKRHFYEGLKHTIRTNDIVH